MEILSSLIDNYHFEKTWFFKMMSKFQKGGSKNSDFDEFIDKNPSYSQIQFQTQ